MYKKIEISGQIEVLTGLHIGGGGEFSAIGAVDSPVVRDPLTRLPMIPGSSIKGKLRSLLSRSKVDGLPVKVSDDDAVVNRLFGSSTAKDENGRLYQSRLQISDAFYCEETKEEFDKNEVNYTEIKFENTINRLTAVANPRQIERVTRGSKFNLSVIYNTLDESNLEEELENLELALLLLEKDYLGGGGTRGNGRVKFQGLEAVYVTGEKKGEVAYEFKNI